MFALSSVLGSFLYTLMLILVAVVFADAGVDLLGIFENVTLPRAVS